MNRFQAWSLMLVAIVAHATSCGNRGVTLEGDVPDDADGDDIIDRPEEEDAVGVEDLERDLQLPCRGEPRSECWAVYTADGCTAQKPFCCLTGTADLGIPCCCEDL